jgi:hypothetical protein
VIGGRTWRIDIVVSPGSRMLVLAILPAGCKRKDKRRRSAISTATKANAFVLGAPGVVGSGGAHAQYAEQRPE